MNNIDYLKVVFDIKEILQQEGIIKLQDIKLNGYDINISCPIHKNGQEKKASCNIITKDYYVKAKNKTIPAGTVHCFTCGYTATFEQFISDCFGMHDGGIYGYKWLADKYIMFDSNTRPKLELNLGIKETKNIEYVSEVELAKYRYFHPYMKQRKLTDEIIDLFDIGYDIEKNHITLPVFDKNGNCVFIQRRNLGFGMRYLFPKNSNKGNYLYGQHLLKKTYKALLVTEGIFDCLYGWCNNRPGVSLMSARATREQIKLLESLPTRVLILALDNDEAGYKGIEYLNKNIKTKILYKAIYPAGINDLNELSTEQIYNLKKEIIF